MDLFQGLNPSFQGLQPSFQGPPSHPATVAILFGLSGWALSSGRRVSYGGLEAHVAGLPFHNIDFCSRQARHWSFDSGDTSSSCEIILLFSVQCSTLLQLRRGYNLEVFVAHLPTKYAFLPNCRNWPSAFFMSSQIYERDSRLDNLSMSTFFNFCPG